MSKRLPCPCGSLDRDGGLRGCYCSQVCRLAAHVSISDSGCWEWIGCRDPEGYGKTSLAGASKRAHRLAYQVLVADVPDTLVLDHLCLNTSCVNPDHLEVVTTAENVARSSSPSTINAAKTRCINGHPFDEENTYRWRGSRICRQCAKGRHRRRSNERRAMKEAS